MLSNFLIISGYVPGNYFPHPVEEPCASACLYMDELLAYNLYATVYRIQKIYLMRAAKKGARRSAAKKGAKKTPAKKKVTAKKNAKRSPAKKAAKKTTARRTAPKKASAKKTTAVKKKTTAKKAAAKKVASKKKALKRQNISKGRATTKIPARKTATGVSAKKKTASAKKTGIKSQRNKEKRSGASRTGAKKLQGNTVLRKSTPKSPVKGRTRSEEVSKRVSLDEAAAMHDVPNKPINVPVGDTDVQKATEREAKYKSVEPGTGGTTGGSSDERVASEHLEETGNDLEMPSSGEEE